VKITPPALPLPSEEEDPFVDFLHRGKIPIKIKSLQMAFGVPPAFAKKI